MHDFIMQFARHPFIVLFITISLGFLIGKFKYKTFVLGGISGSLIVGVILGQFGVKIPSSIGLIFFALFIYAVGFQGGAQFFKSLNRKTLLQLLSASITCALGLLCVILFAHMFHLDRGTAAGLAAGGLTQSAMIGSADSAIAHLGLSHHISSSLDANIAVGYAICYLFGSFGPILLLTSILPAIMGWDIRHEALKLASENSNGKKELEPGEFNAMYDLHTRVFLVDKDSMLYKKTPRHVFLDSDKKLAVESVIRNGKQIDLNPDEHIHLHDKVVVTAREADLLAVKNEIGEEVEKPADFELIKKNEFCILSNKDFCGVTVSDFNRKLANEGCFGYFVRQVIRFGEYLPMSPDLKLKRGDEIEFTGTLNQIAKVDKIIGSPVNVAPVTDFVIFGMGIALGFLIGMISIHLFGVSVPIGSGVGCLLSGLLFGWLRSVKPQYGSLPTGASNFLRDFGLAAFVASVGITAGPQAIIAIKQHGAMLFLLGIGVTVIPTVISFFFSYYVLRIKNPINLLATIAGGRSANPGFAALLEKAGNATPVMPFTAAYTLANVWLTLFGPIIIALITINH